MDPISTGLAGIALVQKSVDFIKSNISTANDIRDIAGAIDGLFQGEKQVQKNDLVTNHYLDNLKMQPMQSLTQSWRKNN